MYFSSSNFFSGEEEEEESRRQNGDGHYSFLKRVFVAVFSIFFRGMRAPLERGGLLSAMETIVLSKRGDYASVGREACEHPPSRD
jgi:hypothetical protein